MGRDGLRRQAIGREAKAGAASRTRAIEPGEPTAGFGPLLDRDAGTTIRDAEPDMAGYAASQPLAHQPGTYQQYSSGSTNVLCGILTDLADAPDADLPRQQLLAPLGLASATWEVDASGTPVCSSYLWATPREWAALGQFALQDGVWAGDRLLPEGWMQQSTTATQVERSEERGYAAGWWSNRAADGGLVDDRLPVLRRRVPRREGDLVAELGQR